MAMDELEISKIVGAGCAALLAFVGFGQLGSAVVGVDQLDEPAYIVEVPEDDAGTEMAEAEEAMPIGQLMAMAVVDDGPKVFKKCSACHKAEDGAGNGVGPNLYGVVGRDIGGVDGFAYSNILMEKEGGWDFAALDGFLEAPKKWAPGTKMGFAGLRKPEDRASVIAWLNEQSAAPLAMPAVEQAGAEAEEPAETEMAAVEASEAETAEAEAPAAEAVTEEPAKAEEEVAEQAEAPAATETAEAAAPEAEAVTEEPAKAEEEVAEKVEEPAATETAEAAAPEAEVAAEEPAKAEAPAATETAEAAAPEAEAVTEEPAKAEEEVAEKAEEPAATETAEAAAPAAEAVTEEPAKAEEPAETVVAEAKAPEAAPAAAAPAAAVATAAAFMIGADAEKGAKVFRKCKACHKVDPDAGNGVGPNLHGVVGRDIASLDGFKYSDALMGKDGAWDFEALNGFLTKPKQWAKGTKMAYPGLRKEADRAAVIAYLNEQGDNPVALPE